MSDFEFAPKYAGEPVFVILGGDQAGKLVVAEDHDAISPWVTQDGERLLLQKIVRPVVRVLPNTTEAIVAAIGGAEDLSVADVLVALAKRLKGGEDKPVPDYYV